MEEKHHKHLEKEKDMCCCGEHGEEKHECCGHHEHHHEHEHEHTCCEHEHTHSCGCSCGHDHSHDEGETKKLIIRMIIGGLLFISGVIMHSNLWVLLAGYFVLGYDVLYNGIKHLLTKHTFSEHLLMSVASIGAFLLGQYTEGCAVMLFYQIGELFCDTASERSEKSIRELIDIKPDYANLITDGKIEKVSPEKLKIGDTVAVSVGEKIPADGIVIEGSSQLDTSSMTGENALRSVKENDEVISGCINNGSLIKMRVTTDYENSQVSKVSKLLEEIEENKSKPEEFLTVFSKYYTPIIIIIAALTAVVPTLIFNGAASDWIYRALVILFVSCPCALIISVPLTFFAANGCASRYGILIKGSSVTEKLSKIKRIAFDKTGTLTQGAFELVSLRCAGRSKAEMLEILAHAEYYSTHPLSEAVITEYKKNLKREVNAEKISDYTEIPGQGISVLIAGKRFFIGNTALMKNNGIEYKEADSEFTVVYAASENEFIGYAEFSDGIKKEARSAIEELKGLGIKTAILSGDKKEAVEATAQTLGADEYYYELMPQDKVEIVSRYQENAGCAFVGDGINDSPVIAKSDVGISMGLEGSDAAIEASDMVILSDDISKIPLAVKMSKRTMKIVWENIIVSIGIKVLIVALGAFGYAGLWLAIFGDVGVSVLAVLNSMRAMKYNDEE